MIKGGGVAGGAAVVVAVIGPGGCPVISSRYGLVIGLFDGFVIDPEKSIISVNFLSSWDVFVDLVM